MKIAYIILAHTAPNHLLRLVTKLSHPADTFYIHIDLKSDIKVFKKVFKSCSSNVIFIENRVESQWGGMGLVQATLNAMMDIVQSSVDNDHIVLLSGADYPIKPTEEIRKYLKVNKNKLFLTFEKFPIPRLNYGGKDRIECYSFSLGHRRETYIPFSWKPKLSLKGKILNVFLGCKTVFKKKRKFPFEWEAYYGSQWWSMSYDAIEFVVDFIRNNDSYIKFHQDSLIPDEMFFQSLLLNAYPNKEHIINENLRYIDFPEKSSHPKTLLTIDLNELLSSEKLFARKFKEGSTVLDKLD